MPPSGQPPNSATEPAIVTGVLGFMVDKLIDELASLAALEKKEELA
jgi:hypothetical protein